MSKWKLIKTVPEMTDVLVYANGKQAVGYCDLTDSDGYFDEPVRMWNVGGWWLSVDALDPTHWMPLPEPPK